MQPVLDWWKNFFSSPFLVVLQRTIYCHFIVFGDLFYLAGRFYCLELDYERLVLKNSNWTENWKEHLWLSSVIGCCSFPKSVIFALLFNICRSYASQDLLNLYSKHVFQEVSHYCYFQFFLYLYIHILFCLVLGRIKTWYLSRLTCILLSFYYH